jgi:hypothetical protein
LRREVRRRALSDSVVGLEIVPSTFPGEEAGALGAAALFLQQPEVVETIAASTPPNPHPEGTRPFPSLWQGEGGAGRPGVAAMWHDGKARSAAGSGEA